MANSGQNTLDVYYPQVLGPNGLDPEKVENAFSRIYDFLYRAVPTDPNASNSTIVTDGFVDQLLLKLHLTSILVTHEVFFASTVGVSWNAHQLNYQNVQYQIPAGVSTNKFIYWQLSKPSAYQTSANIPTLGENDYIIAQYNAAAGTVKEVWQARMTNGGTGINVTGSGTTNLIPKFTDGTNGVIGNSSVMDNGSVVKTTLPISSGTAAGATGQFLLVGLTSGTVVISVADVAGTWTIKLPINAGTANYALKTDGTGITSWDTGQGLAGLRTVDSPIFTGLTLSSVTGGSVYVNGSGVLLATTTTTAPSTSVGVAIVNFYGSSATNFLGTPIAWEAVTIGGTAYKRPLYT